MSIAFLLLTNNDHLNINNISKIIKKGNIYVHPKNPQLVKSFLKDHIIHNLVETEWGKLSIVNAEYNLLKEAFKNTTNKWFILLSESCYPLLSYNTLLKNLNSKDKSFINLIGYFQINNINFFKASQFWILKREDVDIILKYYTKYNDLHIKYENGIIKHGSVTDETFFITLLMNEIKDYNFINKNSTYKRWIYLTMNLHPFVFNKLTKVDKQIIKQNNSFFIRKVTPYFNTKIYKNKENLIIYYIQTILCQEEEISYISGGYALYLYIYKIVSKNNIIKPYKNINLLPNDIDLVLNINYYYPEYTINFIKLMNILLLEPYKLDYNKIDLYLVVNIKYYDFIYNKIINEITSRIKVQYKENNIIIFFKVDIIIYKINRI